MPEYRYRHIQQLDYWCGTVGRWIPTCRCRFLRMYIKSFVKPQREEVEISKFHISSRLEAGICWRPVSQGLAPAFSPALSAGSTPARATSGSRAAVKRGDPELRSFLHLAETAGTFLSRSSVLSRATPFIRETLCFVFLNALESVPFQLSGNIQKIYSEYICSAFISATNALQKFIRNAFILVAPWQNDCCTSPSLLPVLDKKSAVYY